MHLVHNRLAKIWARYVKTRVEISLFGSTSSVLKLYFCTTKYINIKLKIHFNMSSIMDTSLNQLVKLGRKRSEYEGVQDGDTFHYSLYGFFNFGCKNNVYIMDTLPKASTLYVDPNLDATHI